MSNSAPNGRFSRLVSTGNTVSRELPRSSVGAGYRCGYPPLSNAKIAKKAVFFQGPVDGVPGADPDAETGPGLPIYRWALTNCYIRLKKPGCRGAQPFGGGSPVLAVKFRRRTIKACRRGRRAC